MSEATSCAHCFKALADTTRLTIIKEVRSHPMSVQEVTLRVARTQPTVTYHLRRLRMIGMLKREKKGRQALYSFNGQYPCKGCGVFSAPIKA